MKIKCKCGELVVEGEIIERKNKKRFDILDKPKGTIIKNNSGNPKDWTGVCSKCQSSDKEEKK